MTDHVRVSTEAGVQTVRLNRPEKKNALTSPMYEALSAALADAGRNHEIRATLLLGMPGAFTAGNDIEDFLAYARGGGLGEAVLRFLHAIAGAQKPVVAAVDGLAIGVGTTLLFHCDLAFCTPESSFRTPFLDLGIIPEAASTLLAPRRMGHARAFELLCLGSRFDADRALTSGLVNEIVPAEVLEVRARTAALALANKPAGALAAARRLMRGDEAEIHARIDAEAEEFRERLRSPEAKAAFQAFLSRKG